MHAVEGMAQASQVDDDLGIIPLKYTSHRVRSTSKCVSSVRPRTVDSRMWFYFVNRKPWLMDGRALLDMFYRAAASREEDKDQPECKIKLIRGNLPASSTTSSLVTSCSISSAWKSSSSTGPESKGRTAHAQPRDTWMRHREHETHSTAQERNECKTKKQNNKYISSQ